MFVVSWVNLKYKWKWNISMTKLNFNETIVICHLYSEVTCLKQLSSMVLWSVSSYILCLTWLAACPRLITCWYFWQLSSLILLPPPIPSTPVYTHHHHSFVLTISTFIKHIRKKLFIYCHLDLTLLNSLKFKSQFNC